MRELRHACRTLASNSGFTLIAVLSLALGVGANTAMFSWVYALVLRPLPVDNPGRIVEVDGTAPGTRLGGLSYPDYADLRDQTRTLQSIVGYDVVPVGIGSAPDEVPHVTLGVMVTGDFFSGLGIATPVGRAFRRDEDRVPGRDLVTVISHRMFERDFGSNPSVLGRRIRVNGAEFTVIGVAPAGFSGPEAFIQPEIYVPMNSFPQVIPGAAANYLTARDRRGLVALGRLKDGMSAREAQSELATVARRLATHYPETNRDRTVTVLNYQQARFERNNVDAVLAITMMVVAGLVLLIACANVANLVLARGAARAKEVTIRMAIVNQTLAARAWPGRDAIGKRMRLDGPDGPVAEVVGIARNSKYLFWAESPQAALWTFYSQNFQSHMAVELRTAGDPASMTGVVRDQVRAFNRDMPIFNMNVMTTFFEERVMLGPRVIAQMVTAIGVVCGLAIALLSAGLFRSFAVETKPNDPAVLIGVPLILTAVMIAACWVPARRAARVNPTQTLRQE